MKKTRFTETQIVSILNKQEQGKSIRDICREHGISEPTFYNWKAKYGGMAVNELKRMKELEDENSRQANCSQPHPGERCYQVCHRKKVRRPSDKREAVKVLVEEKQLSVRKACSIVSLPRSVACYRKRKRDDSSLIEALEQLVEKHPTIGFWKCYYRLRRQGASCNHKRLYRVYTLMRLNVRRKVKRRIPQRIKQPLFMPQASNQTGVWTLCATAW